MRNLEIVVEQHRLQAASGGRAESFEDTGIRHPDAISDAVQAEKQ